MKKYYQYIQTDPNLDGQRNIIVNCEITRGGSTLADPIQIYSGETQPALLQIIDNSGAFIYEYKNGVPVEMDPHFAPPPTPEQEIIIKKEKIKNQIAIDFLQLVVEVLATENRFLTLEDPGVSDIIAQYNTIKGS